MFSEGCRSANPTACWLTSRRLLLRKKPCRAVDADVAMDARPCVEELWELEAGVPEHRHRRPEGPEAEAGHGKAEQDKPEPDQPLPSPPNLVEVMVVQTQLMQRMAEAMEHHGNGGNPVASQDEDLMRKIERFIRLKAPTFSYSDDPLEVDDWLRVIEAKLDLTVCSDEECVAIAAHQRRGSCQGMMGQLHCHPPEPSVHHLAGVLRGVPRAIPTR
jgi:hypothetical protein